MLVMTLTSLTVDTQLFYILCAFWMTDILVGCITLIDFLTFGYIT